MENGTIWGGPCYDGIMLQHVFFPLFLYEVLRTWETTPLRGTFQRDGVGGGHCVGWMDASMSGRADGFVHFLLCFYVVAIVE